VKARAGDRRVVWHGAYKPSDLSGAPVDGVVLPTLCAESYSFAADEAAALGVPILASDLGALTDRATGRHALFPRGDAAALAKLLAELAADPARRDAMIVAPAPPLTHAGRHLAELSAVYDALPPAASKAPPASAEAELARREHAFTLREAGLHELLRSEGWEDEISRLQAEIQRLQGP
jgi:glycosyltransferase involved in cell wall biosynthesis